VLEPPQKLVGLLQFRGRGRRQHVEGRQLPQGGQRAPGPQPRLAPAADHLEGLGDELDLADAAATELHIALVRLVATGTARAPAAGLGADQRVHLAQRGDCVEIEVLAKDERTHHVVERPQLGLELRGAGPHRP